MPRVYFDTNFGVPLYEVIDNITGIYESPTAGSSSSTAIFLDGTGALAGYSAALIGSFTFDGSGAVTGGTIDGFQYYQGATLMGEISGLGAVFGTIEDMLSNEASGADTGALENYCFALDWDFHGSDADDFLTRHAVSADAIAVNLAGNDRIWTGGGDDRFALSDGNDRAWGGTGNDVFWGENGRDKLFGQAGDDKLFGGSGRDVLDGGSGRDLINGGAGGDRIIGGSGQDQLRGGGGPDVFVFGATNQGVDRISDFDSSVDRLELDFASVRSIYQHDNMVYVDYSGGRVILEHTLVSEIDSHVFI